MASLDGAWRVRRTGGLLPPLLGMRKRIDGARGETVLGPLRMPFDVRGNELRYRAPFAAFVDVLEPTSDESVFLGHAKVRGREYGRFELRRLARGAS